MIQALIAAFGQPRDPRLAGQSRVEYKEMSLYQHVQLIITGENWPKFTDALSPKELFIEIMNPVRIVRNQMAHFRGEIDAVQLDALKQARYWLETRPVTSVIRDQATPVIDVTAQESELRDSQLDGMNDSSGTALEVDTTEVDEDVASTDAQRKPSTDRFDVTRKYARLAHWLYAKGEDETHIRVTFSDIEAVLGEELPPSAYEHTSWWANDSTSHRQSIAWLAANWRVESVDFQNRSVVFRRIEETRLEQFFEKAFIALAANRNDMQLTSKTSMYQTFTLDGLSDDFVFGWSFAKKKFRAELRISTGSREMNETYFRTLQQDFTSNTSDFPRGLQWQQSPSWRSARIYLEDSAALDELEEFASEFEEWCSRAMGEIVTTFKGRLARLCL